MPISTIGQNGLNAPLSLTTPNLGTPSAINLSNATSLAKAALPSGAVLNAYSAAGNTQLSVGTTSQIDVPNLSITLTPVSASSKFILMVSIQYALNGNNTQGFSIYAVRNGSNISNDPSSANYENYFPNSFLNPGSIRLRTSQNFYDSPATASSITYKIQVAGQNTNVFYLNSDSVYYSTLIILEVA